MIVQPARVPVDVAFDAGSYGLRVEDTYRRRQFIEGGWESPAAGYMQTLLSDDSLISMRVIDCSHNIFRDTLARLAVRYAEPPSVPEGELGKLKPSQIFAKHQQVEQVALGCGASIVSVRVVDGKLVPDVLPPDHCDVVLDDSGRIVKLRLSRPVGMRRGVQRYVKEEWDLSGPKPVHRARVNGRWVDQPDYPWYFTDGKPFIPVMVYRPEEQPNWWNPRRWEELIEATLEEALAWTIHRYARLNAGSGTPYLIDGDVVGRTPSDEDSGHVDVSVGPFTMLQVHSRQGQTANLDVLSPAFDAAKDVEAIMRAYDRRMDTLGLGESAFQRSGAEAGYAILLRQAGLQRLQNQTLSMFRQADEEYLRICVACMRLFAGGPPESDSYCIEYAPPQGGSAEAKEQREQEKHDLDIGVATPASILAGRMGIEVSAAEQMLQDLQHANKEEASGGAPAPSSPPVAVSTDAAPAADLALNGAQVAAVLQILSSVSAGSLTPDGAKAVLRVAIPTISAEAVGEMVAGAVRGAVPPA